jgi:hypothetical protein
MKHISLVIFSLILLNYSFVFSQDMRATTNDGQPVILRKNGNWFFYNPSLSAEQKSILQAHDSRATLMNGRIVILKTDGTWRLTDAYDKSKVRNPRGLNFAKAKNPKVAGLAKSGHWGEENWETHHTMLEKPAPALELSGWMNGNISRNAWNGNIVVVDFWATWCGPCRKSIPHNNELFNRYKDRGVFIVGACCSGGRGGQERMGEVVTQLGLEYPTAQAADSFVDTWNVSFFPTYAIVDRKGDLRALGVSPDYVEPIIQALLEEE